MKLGWIGQNELDHFGSLLLPDVRQALAEGQPITALGLTAGDQACGAVAAWLQRGDIMSIGSLYIAPRYRRQGGGRLLIDTLYRLGQGRCQAMVISYTCTQSDHETLAPFLTAIGFVPERAESRLYQISLNDLAQAPFFTAVSSSHRGARPFTQVSPRSLTAAYQEAAAQGENYLERPLTDKSVDQDVSVAVMEGDQVRSFAVFTPTSPGRIRLAWVKSGQPQDLPLLLHTAFIYIRDKYPPETVMTVQAVTGASNALVNCLLPQARLISFSFVRDVTKQAAQKACAAMNSP